MNLSESELPNLKRPIKSVINVSTLLWFDILFVLETVYRCNKKHSKLQSKSQADFFIHCLLKSIMHFVNFRHWNFATCKIVKKVFVPTQNEEKMLPNIKKLVGRYGMLFYSFYILLFFLSTA